MKDVDVYIGTDIRGRKKGTGGVIYLMRTLKADGTPYESTPEIAELDDTTANRLTLFAIRDAIQRLRFGCNVIAHMENQYIASALSQGWAYGWRENGWENTKGAQVQDVDLWEQILQDIDTTGHKISAVAGKHEWTEWINWKLQIEKPLKGVFKNVSDTAQI